MREFFKGWRRKCGCLALVLACLFMGAWIRSRNIEDEIYFPISKTQPVLVFSTQGYIVWGEFTDLDPNDLNGQPPHWRSSQLDPKLGTREPMFFQNPAFTWRWWIYAIVEDVVPHKRFRFLVIPYWSITIPLTLLSAYLLLWKPRTKPKDQPNA